jgi:DNA-binding CsgD family transcriptional regulator
MQHYGLPTRLLDITSNPLVALYFACTTHDKDDEDGEVIVFSFDIEDEPVADGKKGIKYFDSDTVSVISNLSRRPATFTPPNIADIDRFNKASEIKLLLHDVRRDKPHFEPKIVPIDLGRVVCVKPMLDNPRIIRQEGSFLLFGIDETKRQPAKLDPANVVGRLTINMDKKKELADHLQTLGISNATLFPEIERVSQHIKDAYYVPSVDLAKLSEAERKVFQSLRHGPSKSNKEIAIEVNLTRSVVGHQIAKLNEKGLILSDWRDSVDHWRAKKEVKVTDSADDAGLPK